MCICSVTIVPISQSTSISDILVRSIQILDNYPDLNHEVTPMSTQIEGPFSRLLEALVEMHNAAFSEGVSRVYTTITLDDRRDKEQTLSHRVAVIEEKLGV